MLAELFTFLTTPCHPAARRLGYLRELIAIGSRHRRHREAWRPHLDASRRAILDAAERCHERNTIVVMGAGLLLDIPLAELSTGFRNVLLLDVAVLRRTMKTIARFPNVEWRHSDVTGIIDPIARTRRGTDLPAPIFDPATLAGVDLLVSANILSQLPILPAAWVREKRLANEQRTGIWGREIVDHHINLFRSFEGERCLITDVSRVWTGRPGVVGKSENSLGDLPLPEPDKQWQWRVAPLGELSRTSTFHTDVGVFSRF